VRSAVTRKRLSPFRFYALILSRRTVTTLMFSVKYPTTFSEGFYRAEDGCARGYDGPQLRQGNADSEVLNCRYQAFTQACAFTSPFSASVSVIAI
jgi:hypothetical protein